MTSRLSLPRRERALDGQVPSTVPGCVAGPWLHASDAAELERQLTLLLQGVEPSIQAILRRKASEGRQSSGTWIRMQGRTYVARCW